MIIIFILTYILVILINLCIKNLKDLKQLENAILVQETNEKDINVKNIEKIREKYELGDVSEKDLIYDDQGNFLSDGKGISVNDFLVFYLSLSKTVRESFVRSYNSNLLEITTIINILKHFEKSDISKKELYDNLKNFAKECSLRACHNQLSYFIEIKKELNMQIWKHNFNQVIQSIKKNKVKLHIKCYYCNYDNAVFKTSCCGDKKKHICTSCLQQNYQGLNFDKYHPVYCPFCNNKPFIELVR